MNKKIDIKDNKHNKKEKRLPSHPLHYLNKSLVWVLI